ncbi:MAG: alkane 1-monooxygenase [Saprospiraceae bacterium]
MKTYPFLYLLVFLTPILVVFSLSSTGIFSFSTVAVLFVILPAIELFTVGSTYNLTKEEELFALDNRLYDLILYSLVPIQYAILVYFLVKIGNSDSDLITQIGYTTAYGMSCGILGINAAHELGHRHTWYEQWMSKSLLLTTLYMHFFIEHNRGHHRRVSTMEDPASARYGENVYAFHLRSIKGSWLSAWQLERQKLDKNGHSYWSLHNEMLIFQGLQILLVICIYLVFGGFVLLWFLSSAIIGIFLLETVNYIEHYGLQRKSINGKYERTMPIHSWNSNHPFGRLILLELSRHSDHHYMANRKYQILRHFDESPQMPTGYPGMMVLSLIPILWFKVMHKQIAKYKSTSEGMNLA